MRNLKKILTGTVKQATRFLLFLFFNNEANVNLNEYFLNLKKYWETKEEE